MIGIVGIPKDVRKLIGENCRTSRGRIRFKYVYRELRAVVGFYSWFLFTGAVVGLLVLYLLTLIDERVVPMRVVTSAAERVERDPSNWSENLKNGLGNPKQEHRAWLISKGLRPSDARDFQLTIWELVPIAIVVGFGLLIVLGRFTFAGYSIALEEFVSKEVERDRRRTTARYLAGIVRTKQRKR